MKTVSIHFNLNHPIPFRSFSFFELGKKHAYIDEAYIQRFIEQQATRYYLPLLNEFIKCKNNIKFSLSISGLTLDLFSQYAPRVLAPLKELGTSGSLEFIATTYSHGLSFLFSPTVFADQIEEQMTLIDYHFSQHPNFFYNWEGVYSEKSGSTLLDLGFRGAFCNAPLHLTNPGANEICNHPQNSSFLIIPTSYLQEAFGELQFPLLFDHFTKACIEASEEKHMNLTLDFNTFAQQFERNRKLVQILERQCEELKHHDITPITPSDISIDASDIPPYHSTNFTFTHDIQSHLNVTQNPLQKEAFEQLQALSQEIIQIKNSPIYKVWQQLLCVENFLLFSGYPKLPAPFNANDPYSSFTAFMNIISDLKIRINDHLQK